ncbi:hypothetical protein HDU96_008626 [Phlyctochytrium bullatum]|nr:hypothetical protein HDU96_008626 [Phlyctochytrium bullatum]
MTDFQDVKNELEQPKADKPSVFATNEIKKAPMADLKFSFGNAQSTTQPSSFGIPSQISQTTPLPPMTFSSLKPPQPVTEADKGDEDGEDGDEPKEEQVNPEVFMKGAGEESEDTIYEQKTKALRFDSESKGWKEVGKGIVKINEDKTTKKRRLLLRADGSGRVLLNFFLIKGMSPKAEKKTVTFIAVHDGKPCKFLLRVKEESSAVDLSNLINVE